MQAPEYFNETAKISFEFVVEELQKIDKLNPTDQPVIEALAFNLWTLQKCQKTLMEEGFILDGLHGKKEHPAVSISMKAQAKVLESFKVLGIDASMRLKIDKNEDNVGPSEFLQNLIGGKYK
ncbi:MULTISPECIES: phage terminase small subunit P27 family [unclassified Bacillus cereus group]|uniref:phage terminase small subunit P27 family n=1 Tax=unclassified Bacillus cereus group TaxID=2750818 RepID=UPI0022E69DED|nr:MULTISPECIES: phage terminase small subunit P27 family [unclassified Bacillus cereus group]MDA2218764.1 phage terminase small subunit P27 family [Bacillus cereus group sp. Bc228]MDA2230163.1 phage terminase small subunit P27 family [Bacillus cereus group sp. Bc227]